jgi:hypothetical protein
MAWLLIQVQLVQKKFVFRNGGKFHPGLVLRWLLLLMIKKNTADLHHQFIKSEA